MPDIVVKQPIKKPEKKFVFPKLFTPKIPLNELVLFSKHMAMMLRSGMTEIEAVKIIKDQAKSKNFRKMLETIAIDIENGLFLSDALKKYQSSFGELYVGIIRLGEISGTLPENLEYLAVETRKKNELKSKIRSAMIYPMVILFATLGVSGGLVLFVLPKILPIFESLNVELPITTKILIGTANFLTKYYLYTALGFIALIILIILLLKLPAVKFFWTRFLLVIPIFGRMSMDYNVSSITRTLGLLLKSGVKIVEAVATTSNTVSNVVYKDALKLAAEEVKKGGTLYKHFEKFPSIFPGTMSRMIQIGETTGNLDVNLIYLSEFYENELDDTVKNLSSVLEPVLMVIMGLLVGFVAISIITPIYEVTQSIRK